MHHLKHEDSHDLGVPFSFSPDVYAERLAALRESMQAAELDGLISVAQESAFYLFGYDQIGYWVFQAIWIPTDPAQPVRGLCRAADELLMRRSYGIDETVVWLDDDRAADPVSVLADWIGQAGATQVGWESRSHALPPELGLRIAGTLEGRGITLEATPNIVTTMRQVKSADELVYMRRAGSDLSLAYDAVSAAIRPGVKDTDLSAIALSTIIGRGGDLPATAPCIASGSRTLSQTHLSAKPYGIPDADVVTVELAAAVEHYHAVSFRTYFTPGADVAYQRQYEGLVEAMTEGAAMIRAGVLSTEVAESFYGALDRIGNQRRGRHVGYGIGIGFPPSWLDGLRLKSTDEFPLQTGMTFFLLLASVTDDGKRYVGVGDPIVVTDTGYENLMPPATGEDGRGS